jgi:hypothetical protein
MGFPKDINDKIQEQARRIQDKFGMSALTRPEIYDGAAHRALAALTPLQIGQILHPGCRGVALADVPASVLEEYRSRYTDEDLREGQFVVVTRTKEHYVFIMGHETKKRKDRERSK